MLSKASSALPTLVTDEHLESKLYDAEGRYRGEMKGRRLGLQHAR